MSESGLTQVQIHELKAAFGVMDANHDGNLTPDEIRRVIKNLNANVSESELHELINILDEDHDGKINFDEFLREYGSRYAKQPSKDDYRAVFDEFDQDGSGYIDENELYNVVRKFNPSITKSQVDHVVKSIDRDHTGRLTFDEFYELMTK